MGAFTKYGFVFFLLIRISVFAQESPQDSLIQNISALSGKEKVDSINAHIRSIMYSMPDEAMEWTKKAIVLSDEIEYPEGRIMAQINQGVIYNGKALLDDAINTLSNAKSASSAIDYKYGLAYANLSLTTVYIKQGNYDLAIEFAFLGVEASREIDSSDLEISNFINLATIKILLKDFLSAESYLLEAVKLAEDDTEIWQGRLGQIYGNMAVVKSELKDFGSALSYLMKALDVFESIGSKEQIATTRMNIGYGYAQLNDFEKALIFYDSALALFKELGDKRGIAITYKYIAELMMRDGNFNAVLLNSKKGLEEQKFLGLGLRSQLYALLSVAYDSLAQNDKALEYFKKHVSLNDSLIRQTNRVNVERMTKQFEFDKLKNEAEGQAQTARYKLNQRNLLLLVLGALFVFTLVILLLNRFRQKQKLKIVEFAQEVMAKELQIKALMLTEQERKISSFEEAQIEEANEKLSLKELKRLVQTSPLQSNHWLEFRLAFDNRFPHFFKALEPYHLTTNEQRLASLIRLGLASKEVASILAITPNSVSKAKSRLATKLNKQNVVELENFLQTLL